MTIDHAHWSNALYNAWTTREPIDPLTSQIEGMALDDAYRIQQGLVSHLLGDGGRQVGYKIGLTSKPMQQMMGVDEPDYGPVLSTMVYDDGAAIDTGRYIHPKVEAEISLVLDKPLKGPGVSILEAADAVRGAVASIEMVDSRIKDWKIGLLDTISDLASSAATIIGSRIVPLDDIDPRLIGMVITRGGETVATGAGAAALGNPVGAIAWLANTLAPYDITLEAGQFIMTGSLHAAFDVHAGDVIRADFDHLGSVRATFV